MYAKRKLTDLSIKQAILKAKDSTKTVKISDGGGMYLQIQPNGSKYWRMNYRTNRKQIILAFGVWPKVTLTEARRKQEETKRGLIKVLILFREKEKKEITIRREAGKGTQ